MTDTRLPSNYREKLDDLLRVCGAGKPVYILPHDHPDPDAMASAAGVHLLLRRAAGIKSRIVFSGLIERPENRAMKAHLRTPFSHLPRNLFERDVILVLVDAQPGTGNHPLPPGRLPDAVLDHHPLRRLTRSCPFHDVRPRLGACATMVAGYLRAAGVAMQRTLATAFCYAITSETRDLGRAATEEDIGTYVELLRSANLRKLSRIEHSRVPREYFLVLHVAVENAFAHRDIIGTRLGRISRPDLPAQMADLLVTHEGMHWSICTGAFKDRLYVSIRSTRSKARCGVLLKKVLGKEGSAGGHGMLAGGFLPLAGTPEDGIRALEEAVLLRFARRLAPACPEPLPPLRPPPGEGGPLPSA